MSLAIDTETVTGVLLADGWHNVRKGTFDLDSYEFLWSGQQGLLVKDMPSGYAARIMHGGGQSGVCATGFSFSATDEIHVAGPLTAILAVRCTSRKR
jgi:hypothetical protein